MRNLLLKVSQAGPYGLGPVRPIYLLLFIYTHKEFCLFYKVLCLFLNSYNYSSYTFSEYV